MGDEKLSVALVTSREPYTAMYKQELTKAGYNIIEINGPDDINRLAYIADLHLIAAILHNTERAKNIGDIVSDLKGINPNIDIILHSHETVLPEKRDFIIGQDTPAEIVKHIKILQAARKPS